MTAVSLRGIVKRFGAVTACDGIDLDVGAGEIVAVVGENGAGKSTLMHILHGEIAPDAGSIAIAGQEVRFGSPADAIAAGLGMVHQHFMLFPSLTVAENVVFGAEPRRGWLRALRPFQLFDRASAEAAVRELAGRYGLAVDPGARVAELSVGVRQRVEILRLLHRGARVLILDEPTAVLAPAERAGLFDVLARLRAEGRAIVFITHKLDEVLAVSDRAVVLRSGRVVAEVRTADSTPEATIDALAAAMMSGPGPAGPAQRAADARPAQPGAVLLEVADLHVDGRGAERVRGVSLSVRAGEIVGIAGVAGNGQSSLVEALVGLRAAQRGAVRLHDQDVTAAPVAARRAAGLAYVPEDRQRTGLALGASVADNLIMGQHRRHRRGRLLGRRALEHMAGRMVEEFAVRGAGLDQAAAALSGGNQQKLVLARELARASAVSQGSGAAAVLVAEQPTRGVDLHAARAVHEALLRHRDAGHGVLLISADVGELLALADRILVMYEGRILGALDRGQADEAAIGRLMAGQGAAA
jgi:general nucleoside transport system ATP-binding protein